MGGPITNSVMAERPPNEDVVRAMRAGYASIDAGDDFWEGFNDALIALGYRLLMAACTCPDGGRHGHMPECGWVRQ